MQKKLKSPAKEKTKSPTKKEIQKSLHQVKASGKKEVKKSVAKVKEPIVKAGKSPVPGKSKSRAEKKATSVAKQRVVPHIITHGKDHHFIPEHKKEGFEIIHDGKREEKVFHNKEEVALHQENQKVKAGMVSRAGIKRIFNSQGRR